LSLLIFNYALIYAIRKVIEDEEVLEMNELNQLKIDTIKNKFCIKLANIDLEIRTACDNLLTRIHDRIRTYYC